jgi:hypothetical protein
LIRDKATDRVPKDGVFLVVDTAMRQHGLPASGGCYAHEVARSIMVAYLETVPGRTDAQRELIRDHLLESAGPGCPERPPVG